MLRRNFLGFLVATPLLGLTGCAFSARLNSVKKNKVILIPKEDNDWRYYHRCEDKNISWLIKVKNNEICKPHIYKLVRNNWVV